MYKVLLADDEPAALEALRLAVDWEESGYFICGECSNGEEALKFAESLQPDLIVTDIRMPVIDGIELISRVYSDMQIHPECILVSGYDEFEYAKRAIKYGVRHYLLKPVIREELSGVLADVYNRLRQHDRLKGLAVEQKDMEAYEYFERLVAGLPVTAPSADGGTAAAFPDSIGLIGAEGEILWAYALLEPYTFKTDTDNMKSGAAMSCSSLKKELDKTEYPYAVPYIAPLVKGSFGLVLCCRKEFCTSELAEALRESLTRVFSNSFYLVLSDFSDSPALLSKLAEQASAVSPFRFFMEAGSTLLYEDYTLCRLNYSLDAIERKEDIYEALENLDGERLASSVQAVFEAFRNAVSAPEVVELYSTNVVCKGFELIKSMGGAVEEVVENYPDGMLNFAGLSLDDMKVLLLHYCEDVRRYLCRLRIDVQQSEMTRVKNFISKNYKRGITIREMSSQLYIHPVYLGHLIRKWFGCSFNEYMHKMRIEEAKRLLAETERRAADIAAEVGYSAYGAFLQQFEKYVSMKPVEFRNKN